MRHDWPRRLDKYRVRSGRLASGRGERCGAFFIKLKCGTTPFVIADDGSQWKEVGLPGPAWEHASVSFSARCPTWEEMDEIKSKFWLAEETVLQFHVAASSKINHHPFCLHLWKPIGIEVPLPPSICVGPSKEASSC